MKPEPDPLLDLLFRSARSADPEDFQPPLGFETRLMARLREERQNSVAAFCWRLSPLFASLMVGAAIWMGQSEPVETPGALAWFDTDTAQEEFLLVAFPAEMP